MMRRGLRRSLWRRIVGLYMLWSKHGAIISAILVGLAAITAFYLRVQPYVNVISSGIAVTYPEARLDELDPYVNYWLIKYLNEHGLFSWFTLTRNNPDTCIFWFPNCRSFSTTELPGHIFTLYIVYQLVKPLGIDLMDFLSVIPPVLGALTVIGIALVVYEVTRSRLAAIIGSWSFALMFISRNVAGFVVKYSFGIAIAPYVVWLHLKALKTMKLRDFIVAGLVLAYASTLWAGVALSAIPILLTLVLLPIVRDLRAKELRNTILKFGIEILIPLIVMMSIPYYGGRLIHGGIGIVFVAAYLMYVIAYVLHTFMPRRLAVLTYLSILLCVTVAGILGVYVFGIVKLSGKMALALGIRPGGLPETVAEYQRLTMLPHDMVLMLALAVLLAAPLALYEFLVSRDVMMLTLLGWIAFAWFAAYNIAYFHDYTQMCLAVLCGLLLGKLSNFASPKIVSFGKEIIRMRLSLWQWLAILLVIVLIPISIFIPARYEIYAHRYPMIAVAEGFPRPTTAWLQVLDFLRNETPKDSLVISWWDYGYWLAVLGERYTVADGATLNGTQIHILAKFFVSNIDSSIDYLKKFSICKVKDVYVVIFSPVDLFIDHMRNKIYFAFPVTPAGFGDIPKFVSAIIYIATGKRVEQYEFNESISMGMIRMSANAWIIRSLDPSNMFIGLNWHSTYLRNATLPRLFAWGVFKTLDKYYPGYEKSLVPTILVFDRRMNILKVMPNFEMVFSGYIVKETDVEQNYFELVYAGLSQPLPLTKQVAGAPELVRYVMVLVFRLNPELKNSICS